MTAVFSRPICVAASAAAAVLLFAAVVSLYRNRSRIDEYDPRVAIQASSGNVTPKFAEAPGLAKASPSASSPSVPEQSRAEGGKTVQDVNRRNEEELVAEEFRELFRGAVQLRNAGRISEARKKVEQALRMKVDDRIVLEVRDEYSSETLGDIVPASDGRPIQNK